VDTKTLEKIKKKHSFSKKANTAGDPETRKQYNKIRNHVKSLTRKLWKSYEKLNSLEWRSIVTHMGKFVSPII
jgi:hypothetical protein